MKQEARSFMAEQFTSESFDQDAMGSFIIVDNELIFPDVFPKSLECLGLRSLGLSLNDQVYLIFVTGYLGKGRRL